MIYKVNYNESLRKQIVFVVKNFKKLTSSLFFNNEKIEIILYDKYCELVSLLLNIEKKKIITLEDYKIFEDYLNNIEQVIDNNFSEEDERMYRILKKSEEELELMEKESFIRYGYDNSTVTFSSKNIKQIEDEVTEEICFEKE